MRLLLLALFTTLLLAAPASGARFEHNGPDVEYTVAATDTTNFTITGHKLGDPVQQTYTPGAGQTRFAIGAGCSVFITTGIASCFIGQTADLRLTTNDKPDFIDGSGTAAPFDASSHQVFDTKGGDDVLEAGPLDDTVSAGTGNDTVTGGPGADQLHGDAGDDSFTGLNPGDLVDGGAGTDRLDLSGELAGLSISLNGVADDGPLGSDANVVAVENVVATPGADRLSGGDAPERLAGGDGNDTIDARGGGADTIDCGPGASDVATVDETDAVTGCETVELPADPGQPGAPGQPGGTGPAGGGAADGSGGAGAGTIPSVVDQDRDGVVAGVDCDDTRAAVRPGARDVPGNGIDEDCAGGDARAGLVDGRLSFDFTAFPNGRTRVDTLVVRDLQAGGRAELRCAGRCAFRKKVGKANRSRSVNLRKLIRGRLRAGSTLEVRLTAPDTIGRVVRFKLRSGKLPKRTSLCLPPGGKVGRCA